MNNVSGWLLGSILASMLSVSVQAYEAECPDNAVDAAEDDRKYSHCDYSNSGLNGQLNKFFDKQDNPSKSQRDSEAVNVYDSVSTEPAKSVQVAEVALGNPDQLTASVVTSTSVEGEDRDVRAIYNIRESFTLNNGPNNAMNGLYRQMAKYCPEGWSKLAEWAEPSGSSYYLHYQFQCSH